jgi:uncharacterized protein (TIGR02588 family)
MTDLNSKINESKAEPPSRSFAEWVSFAISSLIVGITASLVIYSWATGRDSPPILVIDRPDPVRQANGYFYVPFEISNTGGETAESVQVIAQLKTQTGAEESGDVQIDFLSQGEKQTGAFVFKTDPKEGELVLRVGSYKVP